MGKSQKEQFDQLADLGGDDDAVTAPQRRRAAVAAPIRMMEYAAAPDAAKAERLEGVQRRATSVRQLDPTTVRRSRFANRLTEEFSTPEYLEFAADIKATGGNTVPGKVRKLHGEGEGTFELIYGHRRHQACLDHKLPFLAEICEADDRSLFEQMTRENLFRKDPTPWEWAKHYALGLAELYSTQEELCKANGKSRGHVSMALQLVNLPDEIIAAFPSPTQIQLAWGPVLQEALATNRAGVLKRAVALNGSGKSAPEVLREIVGTPARKGKNADLLVHGRNVGVIAWKAGGVVTVRLNKKTLEGDQVHELKKVLQDFLSERLKK